MIINLPMSGSCLLVSGVAPDQAEDSLSLSVWEVYSDAVILDWYITLTQKFRSVNYIINTISWSKDENFVHTKCTHSWYPEGYYKRSDCMNICTECVYLVLLTIKQFAAMPSCTSNE